MENNSVKSLYLALFILSIIETVFLILPILCLFAIFFDIAIFIIIMILKTKFPKDTALPSGLKFLLISCIIHFISAVLSGISTVLGFIIAYEAGYAFSNLVLLPLNIVYILGLIASLVLMIISCIKIYKEYTAIN